MFAGIDLIPPATAVNYVPWAIFGFIFQYMLRRRHFAFWAKYNCTSVIISHAGNISHGCRCTVGSSRRWHGHWGPARILLVSRCAVMGGRGSGTELGTAYSTLNTVVLVKIPSTSGGGIPFSRIRQTGRGRRCESLRQGKRLGKR